MSNSNKTYNTLEEWKAAFTHHCVIKSKKMTVTDIAQVAHEINKEYCLAMGDSSQLPWDEAPAWQKESAVLGVMFHVENPNAGPDASHNSWMEQKIVTGWKFGLTKDPENKYHPCIVPFEQLPKEQQFKDYLFRQVVHSLKKFL
jgi:hypothetical protein